jgi:Tol biopolymer transport system component
VTKLSGYAHCPVVSPDGTRLAFVWWESPKSDAPAKIGIASFENGALQTALPAPIQEQLKAGAYSKETIEWTPDGKAIDYIQLRDGVSNIWRQPVDGSSATQLTFFDSGRIANFAYSPDFKHVALSRGNFASDVFLIKNSK